MSHFSIRLDIPERFSWNGSARTRDEFFQFLWENLGSLGLAGIHEGTLLSEDAVGEGLETTPWILDGGVAPESRDWVSGIKNVTSVLYFLDRAQAGQALEFLRGLGLPFELGALIEEADQDWNAEWKKSFTGTWVEPHWYIHPPWAEIPDLVKDRIHRGEAKIIELNPGAGFGTGTHETTRLCLGHLAQMPALSGKRVLDFGSGSGILAIAAALLGAKSVVGVEVDELAIDNALQNAALNGLEQIQFYQTLRPGSRFDVLLANILKPILLQNASRLIETLELPSAVILSGLLEPDTLPVIEAYEAEFKKKWKNDFSFEFKQSENQEWRALFWQLKRR